MKTNETYNSGYKIIIENKEYSYEQYDDLERQLYRKEVIEKLPTYEYTLKKDDKSGNYYFYSFEKAN